MDNLFLESIQFKKKHESATNDYSYDLIAGVWKSVSGELLINSEEGVSVGTKKCDIETGEDVKGE